MKHNILLGCVLNFSFVTCFLPLKPYSYTPVTRYNQTQPLYLTPYIESGELEKARSLSQVTEHLEGFENLEQPESYSGFLSVGPQKNLHSFFWFFPCSLNPETAPLVIWLQGGPGSSSLFGLFEIHGPYSAVEIDGKVKAVPNPYSWHNAANIIYIDNPIGAGFSHTESMSDLPVNQGNVSDSLYETLIQWFTLFPEFIKNDFYPFGESYAGKFVPTIANRIHEENAKSPKIKINLKGLGIGDGWMSPPDSALYATFLYTMGLIDFSTMETCYLLEQRMKQQVADGDMSGARYSWQREFNIFLSSMNCPYAYDIRQCNTEIEEDNYEILLGYSSTKNAIHVGDVQFGALTNLVYQSMEFDFMKSEKATLQKMLENYKVLIYNGNMDIICNHEGVLNMFDSMKSWSGYTDYTKSSNIPYRVDSETSGYIRSAQNLRLFLMRNAGHMVPRSQPKYSYSMFKDFIHGQL